MRKQLRAFAVVLAAALAGCASNRQVIRNEMQLKGDAEQTQDGLTFSAKVLDLGGLQKDPRLAKTHELTKSTGSGAMPVKVNFTLLNPPVFEVRVRNQTGHVVRMTGAIFKLIDAAGNMYDPVNKERARASMQDAIVSLQGQGVTTPPAVSAQLNSALQQLKLMDENTQFLPDVADTFLIAFELPIEPTAQALNEWLAPQASLRLKIYEVPTKTNEAGAVTKRVAFEFPVEVKSFRDTYEVGLTGTKLVSTEEVRKP